MGILAPNHVYSSGAHKADDETHDKDVPAFDDDIYQESTCDITKV